jgi:hypothetical protein
MPYEFVTGQHLSIEKTDGFFCMDDKKKKKKKLRDLLIFPHTPFYLKLVYTTLCIARL